MLPAVENAVQNRVAPGSGEAVDHNDRVHRHPGLLGIGLGASHGGTDRHVARIAPFLRSLDGPDLATGMLALRPGWHYQGPRVTLPTPLLEMVRAIAENRAGNAAEAAGPPLRYVQERRA